MLNKLSIALTSGLLFCSASADATPGQRAPWVGNNLEGLPCQGRAQGYGPYDYTSPDGKNHLNIVEIYHFTSKVEALKSGESGYIHGDLDYTLRAFPNHHRALNAMMRYQEQEQKKPPTDIPRIECYLQRATHFAPHDPVPFMIYGIYLHKHGRLQQALDQYRQAEKIQPNHPELLYNLGLLFIDLKKPEQAREYARKAYSAGHPLAGLKNKLKQLGYPI
jgi:tetratricopeptide (TPR) repeat protein